MSDARFLSFSIISRRFSLPITYYVVLRIFSILYVNFISSTLFTKQFKNIPSADGHISFLPLLYFGIPTENWISRLFAIRRVGRMLHELLFALLGYTGDLIVDEREHQQNLRIQLSPDAPISEECTFKLASDISFIQPSERLLYSFFISDYQSFFPLVC